MNRIEIVRPATAALALACLALLAACGGETASDGARAQDPGIGAPAPASDVRHADTRSAKSLTPMRRGQAPDGAPPRSMALSTTADRAGPDDLHTAHDHGAGAGLQIAATGQALLPPPPAAQDGGGAPSPGTRRPLTGSGPVARGQACVLDFTDEGALLLASASYWFDRVYVPWFQDCGGGLHLDLRPTKYSHFHVSFSDPTLEPCPGDPDAHPGHVGPSNTCDRADIRTEPRSHATVHGWDEVMRLRVRRPDQDAWKPFDLTRLRVVSASGARVCYRRADTPPAAGPWLVDQDAGGAQAGTLNGWFCWSHLGPGLWDLSAWAIDVAEVKIAASALTPGTYSIDDMHVDLHD